MTALTITTSNGTVLAEAGDAPLTVGRAPDSTVVVQGANTSRHHLTIRHEDGEWTVENASSQGTFATDGEPVDRLEVRDAVTLHLGSPAGPSIELAPAWGGATETRAFEPLDAETASLDDVALRLEVDGIEHVFAPGDDVTVGRAEGNSVALSEAHSLVSRRHLRFEWDNGRWHVEDLQSTRGTWLGGSRIAGKRPVQGAFHLTLGDADAGTRIRVTTAGSHRAPRRWGPLLTAGGAALAVIIALVAIIATRGGSADAPNTAGQLRQAREATVLVELLDDGLNRLGLSGSGVLVGADGLVLTNAHIAFPASHAARLGRTSVYPDAPLFAVGFASEDGGEVDRFFVAEPAALHPYHDAALLRIVADGNNDPEFDLPFAPLPIGSSADLEAGERVDQLGFPGVAATLRVSVTTRNFQSFAPCTDAPDDDCLASLSDGWLNLSGQPLGGGSSGGPIVRNGAVVGLNQGAVLAGDRAVEQNRAIPIDVVMAELPLE